MVWKNVSITTAVCLLIALPTAADELLWRATSDKAPQGVPAYKGESNPFPQFERPVYLAEKIEEAVDPSIQAAQQTAQQLQELIEAGKFATPRIYQVEVNGYLNGPAGPEVLIKNVWYSKGDQVQVPSERTDQFKNLMQELKGLDADMHNTLEREVQKQLETRSSFQLEITEMDEKQIILTDYMGRRYSVANVVRE